MQVNGQGGSSSRGRFLEQRRPQKIVLCDPRLIGLSSSSREEGTVVGQAVMLTVDLRTARGSGRFPNSPVGMLTKAGPDLRTLLV